MQRVGLKAGAFIALLAFSWAAPITGAALSSATRKPASKVSPNSNQRTTVAVPNPVRIRDVRGRGLLVSVWLNHQGPFTFAVDTGAGVTLVGADVARRAGLASKSGRRVSIGGLSNAIAISGEETTLDDVALGVPNNLLRSGQRAFIVTTLPRGLDGILDPTEAFAPLGYVIDIAGGALVALESSTRLRQGNEPEGGTVVRWIREGGDKRPFVKLGDNRLALIDTGSGFSLGVTGTVVGSGAANHRKNDAVRDLNGGSVEARRVAPTTVSIGSLVLRNVPTEVLIGAHDDAPVILGRGALYPFRITFDPVSRLIEIAPSRER